MVNLYKCMQAETLLNSEELVAQPTAFIQQLIQATQPQNQSLLPNDLQTSSRILSIVVQVLDVNNITNEVY